MADTTNTRLNRIEEKLDRLADAMVSIARAEEKMIALKEDQDHMYERVNRLSQKLDEIELMLHINDKKELKQLAKDYGYDDKQLKDWF